MIMQITVLLIIVVGGSLILAVVSFWRDDVANHSLPIKFRQFMTLYTVAPYRWYLKDGSVEYFNQGRALGEPFHFDFFDWIRYKRWKRCKDKKKSSEKKRKRMERTIANWQLDIEQYCRENNVPMKKKEER